MNFTFKHYLETDSQLAKARLALTVLFPVAALFSKVIWLGTTVHFPITMILFLAGKEFSIKPHSIKITIVKLTVIILSFTVRYFNK